LVVAVTLAVAAVSVASLVEALAPRQLSTVAAFGRRRLSGARTLAAEASTDQVSHLDSIMVVIARPPCGRRDSPAQSVRPQDRISAGPPRLLGSQTAQAQLQLGTVPQIRGFRLQQIVSQIA
jgi:hypothetical protein